MKNNERPLSIATVGLGHVHSSLFPFLHTCRVFPSCRSSPAAFIPMSAPYFTENRATQLTSFIPSLPSNVIGTAHSTVPGESLSQHGPIEAVAPAKITIMQGQTDNPRSHPLELPQVTSVPKDDQRMHRLEEATQKGGDIYSDTLLKQGATCSPMEADRQQNPSSSSRDKTAVDAKSHSNSQKSIANSISASSSTVDVHSDSRTEAPMDRNRPFDDPGLCHIRDVFFCYAFIARFFGIVRKACVGMPYEMYRFEVREAQAVTIRLHKIKCISPLLMSNKYRHFRLH